MKAAGWRSIRSRLRSAAQTQNGWIKGPGVDGGKWHGARPPTGVLIAFLPVLAIRCATRVTSREELRAEIGVEPSVGSVGISCHNALAETRDRPLTGEVIHRLAPWRPFEAVDDSTLEWA